MFIFILLMSNCFKHLRSSILFLKKVYCKHNTANKIDILPPSKIAILFFCLYSHDTKHRMVQDSNERSGECRKEREENEVIFPRSRKEGSIHSLIMKITTGVSILSKIKKKNLWLLIDANCIVLSVIFLKMFWNKACPSGTAALSAWEAIDVTEKLAIQREPPAATFPRPWAHRGHLHKKFHLPSLNHFAYFPKRHPLSMG